MIRLFNKILKDNSSSFVLEDMSLVNQLAILNLIKIVWEASEENIKEQLNGSVEFTLETWLKEKAR